MKNFKRMFAVVMVAIAVVSCFGISASSENSGDIASIADNGTEFVFVAE